MVVMIMLIPLRLPVRNFVSFMYFCLFVLSICLFARDSRKSPEKHREHNLGEFNPFELDSWNILMAVISRAQCGKNLTSFLRSCYSRRIQEALCMPFKYLRVNHDSLLLGAGCDVCYFWKKCSCYRRL